MVQCDVILLALDQQFFPNAYGWIYFSEFHVASPQSHSVLIITSTTDHSSVACQSTNAVFMEILVCCRNRHESLKPAFKWQYLQHIRKYNNYLCLRLALSAGVHGVTFLIAHLHIAAITKY